MATRVASLYAEIGAETGGLKKGLADTKTGLNKTKQDFKSMGTVGKTTFMELSSAIGLANQVLGAAQGFIRDTAGEVLNYAKQVRSLTTAIGATPEEASKLIQVADDVGISFEQMNSAMEAGIRKGVKPTIENIGKLSDEYLSLAPGIERTEFLMKQFGRTGQDLARLMELGSGKIDEMGDSIEGTARLMDQDALDAAEDYRVALDNLSDAAMDVKLSIGQNLIPELQKVADVMTRNIEITRILNAAEDANLITTLERTRAGSFLFGSEEANMKQVEKIAKKLEGYNKMLEDADKRSRSAGRSTDIHRVAVTTLDGTLQSANRDLAEQQAILDGTVSPAKEAANAILAIAAAEDAAYLKARNWKSSMGETVGLLDRLNTMDISFGDKIKDQLDKMAWDAAGGDVIQQATDRVNLALQAGRITEPQAKEMLGELLSAADTLEADINDVDFDTLAQTIADDLHIPLDEAKLKAQEAIAAIEAGALKSYVYTIEIKYNDGGYHPSFGEGKTIIATGDGSGTGDQGGPRASGGAVNVGTSYLVGERGPEMFTAGANGYITPNNQLGGGDTIIQNIYQLPGEDVGALASKVVAMLSRGNRRAAAGAGYAGV